MNSELEMFIESKVREYIRMTAFNVTQGNAKELLKVEVKPLLKGWVLQFVSKDLK